MSPAQFHTPADVFRDLDAKLQAGFEPLAETSAAYLFELSGDGGGPFHLVVDGGRGRAGAGPVERPDLTFSMSAADFLALMAGELDGAIAFMTRRLRMRGDQSLALPLRSLWYRDGD